MLYIRMLLVMLVALYTSRITLNVLGFEDYGIYNVVGGVIVMLSFLNAAMVQATQRHLAYELGLKEKGNISQIFSTSLQVHGTIAIGIIIVAETLGLWFLNTQMTIPEGKMGAANLVYQISIINFALSVFFAPFNASIIAHEKMAIYAYVGIIEVVLKLLVSVSLIWIPFDKLQLYAVLILAVHVIVAGIYFVYCQRHYEECRFKLMWDKRKYIGMFSFGGWNIFGSCAWIGRSQGMNLILNMFFGPVINAAYGIANQVNVALNGFVQNFMTALNPQLVKSYASNDFDNFNRLLDQGCKFSFLLFFLLAAPILFVTEPLLTFWLKNVPDYSVIFTRLIVIITLIDSYTYAIGGAVQATGKIKMYQIVVGLTILLCVPVGWVALKMGYPPYSVFIVVVVSYLFTMTERLLIMKKVVPSFSVRRFILNVFQPTLLTAVSTWIVCQGLSYIQPNLNFILLGAESFFAVCLLTYFIGLTSKERKLVTQNIKEKVFKIK